MSAETLNYRNRGNEGQTFRQSAKVMEWQAMHLESIGLNISAQSVRQAAKIVAEMADKWESLQ